MIIANPIYDTIFKHLMEDLSIAQRFLSIILQMKITSLSFHDREGSRLISGAEDIRDKVRLFRLDFLAEIETPEGQRKVLIELQKSHEHGDAHRFRAYIGQAYSKDKESFEQRICDERRSAEAEGRKPGHVSHPDPLPIIPVVILGFKLDITAPTDEDRLIFRSKRQGTNPNAKCAVVDYRYKLAEFLSHDLVLIQIPYIPAEPVTEIERTLSIFEQRFLCDDTWKKDYRRHPGLDESLLWDMLNRLNLITVDPEVVKEIREEEEGDLFYTNIKAEINSLKDSIQEKEQKLHEKEHNLQEKDQKLQEKDQKLQEKDQKLQENQDRLIENQRQLLESLQRLHENERKLRDGESAIALALDALKTAGYSETEAKAKLGLM